MLVRIRYSHALRFVPGVNWWNEAIRLGVRLLNHVLGVCWVAGHPQRGRVELVKVLQRVSFEPLDVAPRPSRRGQRHFRAADTAASLEPVGMLITYESSGELRNID